jgi:hypothetical protein
MVALSRHQSSLLLSSLMPPCTAKLRASTLSGSPSTLQHTRQQQLHLAESKYAMEVRVIDAGDEHLLMQYS